MIDTNKKKFSPTLKNHRAEVPKRIQSFKTEQVAVYKAALHVVDEEMRTGF